MIDFDIPKQKSSIIKVIGVGGGGGNAVNHMFSQKIENVDFIICNTDAQALENSAIPNRIQLGPHLTQGLGAGANPSIGRQATEESLEEIKRILEVNTKMAFVCAGMGGGTGTGGAPIIAKICQELDILTVGIVTTPFSFEGPRRRQQAENGIKELEPHVDTLLVISNDKLRMQHKNLKMREAFGKADNVLSTAAKCITDIINSNGQINVDFADVCTVMRKGGVAILGSATAEGESRAQTAIEDAINSPLLNDNDISGAKWILLNINTSEGEFECGTDEFELINDFVRQKAGDNSDVIVGMGIDESLGKGLAVTLIATGFEHKDPFDKNVDNTVAQKDKVVFTLDMPENGQPNPQKIEQPVQLQSTELRPTEQIVEQTEQPIQAPASPAPVLNEAQSLEPTLIEPEIEAVAPVHPVQAPINIPEEPAQVVHFTLQQDQQVQQTQPAQNPVQQPMQQQPVTPPVIAEVPQAPVENLEQEMIYHEKEQSQTTAGESPSNGFLNKPANIYAPQARQQPQRTYVQQPVAQAAQQIPQAELQVPQQPVQPVVQQQPIAPIVSQPAVATPAPVAQSTPRPAMNAIPKFEEEEEQMQIVYKETPKEATPSNHVPSGFNEPEDLTEEEIKRRKAEERIQKLRNLSYNIQHSDPNSEFDAVPAYVRRNLEMLGGAESTAAENYYSKYTVSKDDHNDTNISSINAFLEGKKPD
ncbi:MAG TPA: cell division protein FtsZ [Arachidicoccus sp.]|nr:cell division protein FtsZ [Arachidicoccus sp.]